MISIKFMQEKQKKSKVLLKLQHPAVGKTKKRVRFAETVAPCCSILKKTSVSSKIKYVKSTYDEQTTLLSWRNYVQNYL